MALDIVAQDIIIDETTGLQDDDVDPSVAPHDTNTTLQYLLSLDGAGGLTSPEVAFKARLRGGLGERRGNHHLDRSRPGLLMEPRFPPPSA